MKNIEITIKSFGRIKQAKVPIKPFTLIAGGNAPGKSFITRGLYCVLSVMNQEVSSLTNPLSEYLIKLQSPTKACINLQQQKLKTAFLANFQLANLSELKNKLLTEQDNPQFIFNDNSAELIELGQDSLKVELSESIVNDLRQYDNIIYLESPVFWKVKEALKLGAETSQHQALKGVPEYILDMFELMKVDTMQQQSYPELEQLQQQICDCIGGNVSLADSGAMKFTTQGNGSPAYSVDLNQTASGATSLGIIALLLKKQVIIPGSVLIFDEPEVNLHPAWQQVMVQVLYKLSAAGIYVIMASHSFDMIETIEKMVDKHEEAGHDVKEHFVVVQLEDGQTINEQKPLFKKLSAVKADLGMPFFDLFAGQTDFD